MSNSALISCKMISPNKSKPRKHKIDRITPHCVVGQLSAKAIGNCFISPSRKASCNYGIGSDGQIVLVVDEKDRSWCSSSSANDNRAVTIECASDKTAPYTMNNIVYETLIKLCADICQRNGINKLLWLGSKEKTLAYMPKSGEAVLTAHRWFANKSCPGDWLYSRYDNLAEQVIKLLSGNKLEEQEHIIASNFNPFMEPTVNVKKGTKGEGAKWVQWCLWRFGLLDQNGIDGVIGSESEFAILTAQKRLGLKEDGIIGKITRRAFISVLTNSLKR